MKKVKKYLNIGIDDLSIYAISQIVAKKEECTQERIIKECFTLFPERFGMARYPQWPDFDRVHLSIVRCQRKGWITGSSKTGFKITSFGESASKKIVTKLNKSSAASSTRKPVESSRGKWESIIKYLKSSDIFKRYEKDPVSIQISDKDVRKLMVCTLESPIRVVRQNLVNSLGIAKEFKDKILFSFLLACADALKINLDDEIRRF